MRDNFILDLLVTMEYYKKIILVHYLNLNMNSLCIHQFKCYKFSFLLDYINIYNLFIKIFIIY